ncbi:hypothetical protein GXW82_39200 [Streptacidiphilus sp. 4-A2]|nr:hypothetical protein [Streptacidiphilus sp. 4-A2]
MLAEAEFSRSDLTEMVFDSCTLRQTEFGPGTYRDTDLRGSDLSTLRGAGNLKRAIISPFQESELARALISDLDLTVADDPQ